MCADDNCSEYEKDKKAKEDFLREAYTSKLKLGPEEEEFIISLSIFIQTYEQRSGKIVGVSVALGQEENLIYNGEGFLGI